MNKIIDPTKELEPTKLIERDTLPEASLTNRPEFYDSIANTAEATQLRGGENVYDNLFRLIRVFDVEFTVEAAIFDPFFLVTTPGVANVERQHLVKGRTPIVEVYTSSLVESVVISNALVNKDTFSFTAANYNTTAGGTYTVRAHVYEVRNKKRRQ